MPEHGERRRTASTTTPLKITRTKRESSESLSPAAASPVPNPDGQGGSKVARSTPESRSKSLETGFVSGGTFILDSATAPEPWWGAGADVLASVGEPCLITGPVGSGKTTLLGSLVRASLGLCDSVLGFPVKPANRVLYLACDRPQQIARNLHRIFTEADRAILDDRFIAWPGPPPGDMAANPALLLDLCLDAGLQPGDRVFLDGVKDVALGLSTDEGGAGLAQSFQRVVAAGIDLVGNHHQRKSGEGGKKPKSLTDMYGSIFISATCGTVLLVWADKAGSPNVEFKTLKPAADHIGPLSVFHDFQAGTMTVTSRATVASVLSRTPTVPVPLADICRGFGVDPADRVAKESVRRQADKEVEAGRATRTFVPTGRGGKPAALYQWDEEV